MQIILSYSLHQKFYLQFICLLHLVVIMYCFSFYYCFTSVLRFSREYLNIKFTKENTMVYYIWFNVQKPTASELCRCVITGKRKSLSLSLSLSLSPVNNLMLLYKPEILFIFFLFEYICVFQVEHFWCFVPQIEGHFIGCWYPISRYNIMRNNYIAHLL